MAESARQESFTAFVRESGDRLKHALIAALGGQVGEDATAEALVYGWRHWDRISEMDNPCGYLYRVGRTRGLPRKKPTPLFSLPDRSMAEAPWIEPGLPAALGELTEMQRTVVMLVHCFGWSYRETARLLDVSPATVQRHLARGMEKLRSALRVDADV